MFEKFEFLCTTLKSFYVGRTFIKSLITHECTFNKIYFVGITSFFHLKNALFISSSFQNQLWPVNLTLKSGCPSDTINQTLLIFYRTYMRCPILSTTLSYQLMSPRIRFQNSISRIENQTCFNSEKNLKCPSDIKIQIPVSNPF